MDGKNYKRWSQATEPPLAVKRAMAFAAIAAGCQNLLLYSFADLFRGPGDDISLLTNATIQRRIAELQQLGQELRSLEPFLLAPDRGGLHLAASLGDDSTLGTIRQVKGEIRVILVNGHDQSQLVNLSVTAQSTAATAKAVQPASVYRRAVWMEPWDVQVLQTRDLWPWGHTEPESR